MTDLASNGAQGADLEDDDAVQQPLVMSAAEAGQVLGVSDQTIYEWMTTGVLPEVLRGASRRRLVPVKAVRDVIAASMEGWDPSTAVERMRQLRAVS